jgi:hypothetical protein
VKDLKKLLEIKRRHSADLLGRRGVCGVDVDAVNGDGRIVVHLETNDAEVRRGLPSELEGVPIHYQVTGPIRKL